jgi:hypothetical protein
MSVLCWLAVAVVVLQPVLPVLAWGPAGHGTIGNEAVAALDPASRAKVMEILGVDSAEALAKAVERACFWPDTVRDNPEWAWSAPLHYVNLPRYSEHYDRQRDCPDGLCVTEGILKYAARLGRPGLDREKREEAFAWLCHLVGDLHQPLHAGFRDDRGGNQVTVQYRGKRYNLHRFWDSGLVSERLSVAGGEVPVSDEPRSVGSTPWNPADVVAWTEESHAIAIAHAYPPGEVISEAFAEASWGIVLAQWHKAAARLAAILEAVLAEEPPAPQP